MDFTEKNINNFWRKVDKEKSEIFYNGERCWEWTGYIRSDGYGQLRIDKKTLLSHRVSWILNNGETPKNISVCHHCDNPMCINPDHLFLGTRSDNMQDMLKKKRGNHQKGDKNGNSKISNSDVFKIKKFYSDGKLSHHEIGNLFNISGTQVGRILQGKSRA